MAGKAIHIVILSDLKDFRVKNHDFSPPATEHFVHVIEAVQNVEIIVFQHILCSDRFFLTFLYFCRVPIEDFSEKTALKIRTMQIANKRVLKS